MHPQPEPGAKERAELAEGEAVGEQEQTPPPQQPPPPPLPKPPLSLLAPAPTQHPRRRLSRLPLPRYHPAGR